MHEQKRNDPDQPYHGGNDSRDGGVGGHNAKPRLPTGTHETEWQPVLNDEQKSRTQAEQDDRVSINAITKPTPSGQREVLVHCQRVDVPGAAAIEITRSRVVNGVSASPKVVRRERENTDHTSYPVVCETVMEKSAMTAIVLNHKQPHEKNYRPPPHEKTRPKNAA